MEKRKWMGPEPVCDFCGKKITTGRFIDGKTLMGPWALMCKKCHCANGVGIGQGRGQEYDAATLEKAAG